jgi:hypothetical protein
MRDSRCQQLGGEVPGRDERTRESSGGDVAFKNSFVWNVEVGKQITSVIVDPDHGLPDDDRSNNEKKAE